MDGAADWSRFTRRMVIKMVHVVRGYRKLQELWNTIHNSICCSLRNVTASVLWHCWFGDIKCIWPDKILFWQSFEALRDPAEHRVTFRNIGGLNKNCGLNKNWELKLSFFEKCSPCCGLAVCWVSLVVDWNNRQAVFAVRLRDRPRSC